jgi:hypothetical protein
VKKPSIGLRLKQHRFQKQEYTVEGTVDRILPSFGLLSS